MWGTTTKCMLNSQFMNALSCRSGTRFCSIGIAQVLLQNRTIMTLCMDAFSFVIDNHFYPSMKKAAPGLRSSSRFERRLRDHIADVKRSPFHVRDAVHPVFTPQWFWDIHPQSLPWAIFTMASTGCRGICQNRLELLGVARIPTLPSCLALASLRVIISRQYFSVDDRGECFADGSKWRATEAGFVFKEMAVVCALQHSEKFVTWLNMCTPSCLS